MSGDLLNQTVIKLDLLPLQEALTALGEAVNQDTSMLTQILSFSWLHLRQRMISVPATFTRAFLFNTKRAKYIGRSIGWILFLKICIDL